MNKSDSTSEGTSCVFDTNQLVEQYKERRKDYDVFSQRLRSLLVDLLEAEDVPYHLIEGRAKEVESLSEKICRPGKSYGHSLDEIPDLCGLRIIAYYADDVERIAALIRREFAVDLSQSADKRDALEENEFGYLSLHFVVKLHHPRAGQVEWKKFAELNAEIQVRTVLQHAWASISHELEYKSKNDIPRPLKRKLYRLCGLFELADEEFSSLKNEHDQLSAKIGEMIAQNALDIDITLESLSQFIDHSGLDGHFIEHVEDLGWNIVPYCYGSRLEDYADLRAICDLLGIQSIKQLKVAFDQIYPRSKGYLGAVSNASPGSWTVSALFVLQILLLMHSRGDFDVATMRIMTDWDYETIGVVANAAKTIA